MNWKTTVVLAVLLVAGGACWFFLTRSGPDETANPTLAVLEKELTPDRLTRIEVRRRGKPVILEKGAGGEWSLPGKWPVRPAEVKQLVDALTNLRSRFVPIPLSPSDLRRYGLDSDPLVVRVKADGKDHELAFGRNPDEANRFAQATYVRLDQGNEVVRLAPGILAVLDRPQEEYQQRRLFPAERVAKEGSPDEKEERLTARAIEVTWGKTGYSLVKKGDAWELRDLRPAAKGKGKFEPGAVRDRPDPEKLKGIRTAIPDLWVERFVDAGDKGLDAFGLKEPEETIEVTRSSGDKVTLLVGKESRTVTRRVQKPPPPIPGPPKMPPLETTVTEAYRFARLEGNDQVFEIKGNRLKDVEVAADTLRDPQVARFRAEDVRRVEVHDGGRDLVFVHDADKDRWRVEKPAAVEAERGKVTELLDKLAGLEARGPDVTDGIDPKKHGLEKPVTVKLTLEEEVKGDGKGKKDEKKDKAKTPKKTREIVFALGKHDTDAKKLYVRVEGSERVSAVDDAVLKLVQRPVLAYRSRRVLDFAAGDIARIDVQRPADPFALKQDKGVWSLAAPVEAKADDLKADQLARDLGQLEAVEFVKDNPTPEELKKDYGLDEPAVTAKIAFTDPKKPAQTVVLGKQRPGKDEWFARAGSDPAVFVVKKDTKEVLTRASLAYRPAELWRLRGEDVAELRVRKDGPEYRLKREGKAWKVSGPFEATVTAPEVRAMADGLAELRAEKYVAHATKEPAKYGLEKPYLRVTLVPAAKKPDDKKDEPGAEKKAEKKDEPKEHVLLIGDPTENGAKTRFARLGGGEAVFVIGEKVVQAADHAAVDLLDRKLLALDFGGIQRVQASGPARPGFTLQREKEEWRLTDSPAPAFKPDAEALEDTLRALAFLRAHRFAAYGPKVDPAPFGLDKPALTLRVTVQTPDKDKPGKSEHTVALGKVVPDGKGERYARVDDGPGVAVLDADTVRDLYRTHLDFVSRSLLRLDPERIVSLKRTAGAGTLELVKADGKWRLVKPTEQPADQRVMEELVRDLAGLRAERVADYPVKDLKPFGLEKPAAMLTIRLLEGKDGKKDPTEHVLQLGNPAPDKDGKPSNLRYARVDKSEAVVVVGTRLGVDLLAPPLQFRDRDLAKAPAPDRVAVERAGRKVTFSRGEDGWKMTEPVEADAESAELDKLVKDLSRLRADELVAEAPGAGKAFGLDRPRARWRLRVGDKEVLTLLVGDEEKGAEKAKGPRRAYAQLANGPLVFLLDAGLSEKVLAEYRSRKFWPRVDAAQVEKVTYRDAKGAFTLQKLGSSWEVAGKPGQKVNADAVRDVLDALDGLQAERYVVDGKADLKLYGLEKPLLVVEVETPSGKRVVHIGKQEGESHRRYASVPDSSAVFVISEAAARRIVRPPEAFTAGKL